MMWFGSGAQVIQHKSRLHPGVISLGIQLEYMVQILRHVEDNGHVAALAGQACSSAPCKPRRVMVTANCYRLNDVYDAPGYHYPDRHLTVIGSVSRIQCTAPIIKPDFAFHCGGQIFREPGYIYPAGVYVFGISNGLHFQPSSQVQTA
jgi:hypothetical protein